MAFSVQALQQQLNALFDRVGGDLANAPIDSKTLRVAIQGGSLAKLFGPEIRTALASYNAMYDGTQGAIGNALNISLDTSSSKAVKVMQAFSLKSIQQMLDDKQPFIKQLGNQIGQGIIREQAMSDALRSVKGSMQTTIKAGLAGVQRTAQNEVSKRIQDTEHPLALYSGGLVGTSREYCRALDGKVVDLVRIRRVPNGHGLDPSIFCGGYNCRHNMLPVNALLVKAMNLTVADDSDYLKARLGAR